MNGAQQTAVPAIISHAHARDLAECWQDASRDDHPVTRLASSGEITPAAARVIEHDLRLLESASASWGYPSSIPEKQLRALLTYVLHHGVRSPLNGWTQQRDAEFVRSIRRMASEVRAHSPPDGGGGWTPGAASHSPGW